MRFPAFLGLIVSHPVVEVIDETGSDICKVIIETGFELKLVANLLVRSASIDRRTVYLVIDVELAAEHEERLSVFAADRVDGKNELCAVRVDARNLDDVAG